MSNYLRNVAHRVAGASLLRPRVPSRFEPAPGMGPGFVTPTMDHFREAVTERVVEVPRVTQASKVRPIPPPTLSRVSETPVRREEARATTTPVEAHAFNRKTPEIDRPRPLQESRTENDSTPNAPTTPRSRLPEIAQEPSEVRVPIAREVIGEREQPPREQMRPTVQPDAPMPVAARTPQVPAPTPERRPERHTPAMKAEPQIRTREFPVAAAPGPYAQPAVLQHEIAAPSIHVSIGKVTVQATLPAAPVHAPVRAAAHSGPRLTLERYLERRGGRP